MLLPATTGDFGVMPGHVPTVAQLRPGVVTVHKVPPPARPLAAAYQSSRGNMTLQVLKLLLALLHGQ